MKTQAEAKAKADVATVISKALEIFGPTGEHWLQGTLTDDRGNFCMLGGLEQAGVMLKVSTDLINKATVVVAQACPTWRIIPGYAEDDIAEDAISLFNDTQLRNYEAIKNVMCKALHMQTQLRKVRKGRQ